MFFDPHNPYKHIQKPTIQEQTDPPIKNWSVSALQSFRQCQYKVYLRQVKRLKPKENQFAQRGINIHDEAEKYIKGEADTLSETFKYYKDRMEGFRKRYSSGNISIEEKWAFDCYWGPVEWNDYDNIWCRVILDVGEFESETSYKITDFKTGKKFGNEGKHGEQLIVYAVAVVHRFPQVQHVAGEFLYLDQKDTLEREYNRKTLLTALTPIVNRNSQRITTATTFLPNPGRRTCEYCGFYENGCEWGSLDA